MIHSIELAESFFAFGVACAAIIPRHHETDNSFFGGKISRPFRSVLFTIVCIDIVFHAFLFLADFVFQLNSHKNVDHLGTGVASGLALGAFLWSASFNFLCFVMPYLLLCTMQDFININPSKTLMPWLKLVMTLLFIGVVLAVFVDEKYWAIKKVADAICSLPVLYAIKLNEHVHHDNGRGRKDISSQTLVVLEWFNFCVALLGAIGYWITGNATETDVNNSTLASKKSCELLPLSLALSISFRLVGRFVKWARLLFHSVLLNMVDERALLKSEEGIGGSSAPSAEQQCSDEDFMESGIIVVKTA